MERLEQGIKKLNWAKIYVVLEYIVVVYVALTAVVRLLDLAGMISFEKWFMQPTFWGASLLIVTLLQYGLIRTNGDNERLSKMRPYVVGVSLAGIVSTCNTPLILLMLLVLGYFLMTGYGRKYDAKDGVLTLLVACVCIEVYSVAMLLAEGVVASGNGFLHSLWPDVLFVLVAIVYCIVNPEEEESEGDALETEAEREPVDVVDVASVENETGDVVADTEDWETISDAEEFEIIDLDEEEKKANGKFAAFKEKLSAKKKHCAEWVDAHSKQIARIAGGSICVVALGLFLFYYVATSAGANKIANSGEDVYLLQHYEDNSQVLTLVEDEANEGYTLAFQEYTGANTQKVQIVEVGDDLYQLVFVEGEYALEVTWDQETGAYVLAVNPKTEDFTQWWLVEEVDPAEMEYRFLCAYSVPLCYQALEQGNGISALAVQASTGGHETFVLERTVADGFTTEMVYQYGAEMKPTMLMETLIGYLGGFSAILFIAIVFMLCVMIYSRRLLGDKPAVLYAVVFAFMLAYASVWAIALFLVVYGLLCVNAYLRKQQRQKKEL